MARTASKAWARKGSAPATALIAGAAPEFLWAIRRGFDREHVAVRGLVVARSCTDVYDAFRITQGRIDQPMNSRVRPSDPRIADGRHRMSRGTSLHVPYGSHLQISVGRIENSAIEFLTCGAIYGSWLRLPISTTYHDWRPVSIFEVPGWSPSGAFVGLVLQPQFMR